MFLLFHHSSTVFHQCLARVSPVGHRYFTSVLSYPSCFSLICLITKWLLRLVNTLGMCIPASCTSFMYAFLWLFETLSKSYTIISGFSGYFSNSFCLRRYSSQPPLMHGTLNEIFFMKIVSTVQYCVPLQYPTFCPAISTE